MLAHDLSEVHSTRPISTRCEARTRYSDRTSMSRAGGWVRHDADRSNEHLVPHVETRRLHEHERRELRTNGRLVQRVLDRAARVV